MSAVSLTRHVTPLEAGAHVTALAFLGRTPVLALGDGTLVLAEIGAEQRLTAHPDASILCAVSDDQRLVTGGDDGRVVALKSDGTLTTLATHKGHWIDTLALRQDGSFAFGVGKKAVAHDPKGNVRTLDCPSTVRGLAFTPKGYRLGVAHYNGVSLWFPNTDAAPDPLAWKGSHLDVTFSPDGRFAVSSMQENCLHGWRLSDKGNMRMTGYPAKTRSLSWSHDGNWLATSGAEGCIIWPFASKEGPMGKSPRECGVRPARVSCTAFHPTALIVALGYDDGWVMLCRLTDGAEILVRTPPSDTKAGPVTALAWNGDGKRLLFGTADGMAGLLDLPA